MGKDRAHRIPCRIDRGNVRPFLLETMMTDLEIVLFIAFVFMFWAYRYQHKRADYFKGVLLAVGTGVVTIEVDQDRKTYKLGMPK